MHRDHITYLLIIFSSITFWSCGSKKQLVESQKTNPNKQTIKQILDNKETVENQAELDKQTIEIKKEPELVNTAKILDDIDALNSKDSKKVIKAIKRLRKHKNYNFSDSQKEEIASNLYPGKSNLNELIKLAGFLNMGANLDTLNKDILKTTSLKNAHKLALVRSGDEKLLANMMKNIKAMPVNDDFIYQVAPLLIYTRQKEAIDYLLEIIMSDNPSCTPADAETNGAILCAYRLMEQLVPVIHDYPFEQHLSGNLKVDSYEEALLEMRQWIRDNRYSYLINTETY